MVSSSAINPGTLKSAWGMPEGLLRGHHGGPGVVRLLASAQGILSNFPAHGTILVA